MSMDGRCRRYDRASRADRDLILPVFPIDIVEFQVAGNGRADGREEVALAKLRKKSKPLQLVLYGVLELGKAKLDASRVQRLVQLGDRVAGGNVDTGDRLRRDDQPTH